MVKKMVKYSKFILCIALILSLVAPSYAALSASDGSAFVTKAEFDSALADFNARLTTFEAGINSKIDSQVTSYLDRNGIWNGKTQDRLYGHASSLSFRQMGSTSIVPLIYKVNKSGLLYLQFHGHAVYSTAGYLYGTTQYKNLAVYQWRGADGWSRCCVIGKVAGDAMSGSELAGPSGYSPPSYATINLTAYNYTIQDWGGAASTSYSLIGPVGSATGSVENDLKISSWDTMIIKDTGSAKSNYLMSLSSADWVNPTSSDCYTYSSYIQVNPVGWADNYVGGTIAPYKNSQYQVNIFMFVTQGGGVFMQLGFGFKACIAPDDYVGTNTRTAGYVNSAVVY